MKKTIIAIWGNANTGKSSSIKKVFELCKMNYPNINVVHEGPLNTFDITKIIVIDGIKIGIESQGDPNSNLFTSLKLFQKENCDIIVCATRTKGKTVEEVMKYESNNGYDVIWLSNLFSGQKNIDELNNRSSTYVFSLVDDIRKGVL